MNKPMTPPKDAIRFLKALDPKAKFFTFQTFDDVKLKNGEKRDDKRLTKILHGTLEQHHPELASLNSAGAGIYVTINETDGKGREADNIVRVRAWFVDLDKAPLEPVLKDKKRKPHIVVETSPGRWAAYWLAKEAELDQFTPIQKGLIATFKSDPAVKDKPRVMRLPGYMHNKGKPPFKSRIMKISAHKPFSADAFDDIAEDDGLHLSNDLAGDPDRIKLALKAIPNGEGVDYDFHRMVMTAAHNAGGRYEDILEWCLRYPGYKEEDIEKRWDSFKSKPEPDRTLGMGTLVRLAKAANPKWDKKLTIDDYYAHLPDHRYICAPVGGVTWPAASINATLPKQPGIKGSKIEPSLWLDRNRAVHSLTWAPGEPELIRDKVFNDGGWVEHPGLASFNRFRPADIDLGDAREAKRWVEHVRALYPKHCEGILDRFAHTVQKPGIKINHATVFGGPMGVGKDMILAPLREAVGPWNFKSIPPWQLFGTETGYVASVVLNINEANNLKGAASPQQFYEEMKQYAAAPPITLVCNIKHIPRHYVLNVCNVYMTTNKPNGLFLPADDRRNWVLWTDVTAKDLGGAPYYKAMWEWLEDKGYGHVAALLHERDISHFNPKAEPEKTAAFMTMVAAHMSNEDDDMGTALATLANPDALTIDCLAATSKEMEHWLKSTSPRIVGAMLKRHDYAPVRNPNEAKGRWLLVGGKRVVIYAKTNQIGKDRLAAATALKATLEKELKGSGKVVPFSKR